jgi:hypothetical protein
MKAICKEDKMARRRVPVTYLDAATAVLGSAKGPLSTQQILNEAKKRGLVAAAGKTPLKSMAACLYVAAKRPDGAVEVMSERSLQRAVRGSVRWQLRRGSLG